MMSSMSFSPQPEFFARSLKRRLQSLAPERDLQTSPPLEIHSVTEECQEDISGNKDNRIRKILEHGLRTCDGYVVKMPPAFPPSGTTFPPNGYINGDLIRAKFHSDSNFQSSFKHTRKNDENTNKKPLVNGNDMNLEEAVTSSSDTCDSDLFFDFDIGSPDHAESDEERSKAINVDNGMDLVNGHSSGNDSTEISPSLLGSTTDQLPTLIRSPDHSTTYGSTSSGLFSDQDTPSPSDNDDNDHLEKFVEGFSLHPEDWLKTQQSMFARLETNSVKSSSVTPTMSPHTRSPPADKMISPPDLTPPDSTDDTCADENIEDEVAQFDNESPEEDSTSRDDSSSSQSDDLEAGKELKICIGSQEKSVAHSKLQLLLAQLDKGKSYSLPDRNHLKVNKKEVIKAPVLSSSPANFSYLVGSLPSSKLEMSSLTRSIKSQSTPDMSELDKLRCASMSPRPDDDSSSSDLLDSSPIIEIKNEKKEAYRKCSSLRSGKTPPSTPGRRKIVRFADVFGLDLADVKTFLDEVPRVPRSAFKDLTDAELSDIESDSGSELHFPVQPPTGPPTLPTFSAPSTPTIAPLFNQPSGSTGFFTNLRDKKVCLESAYMSDLKTIRGTVRVVNLDFNKKVVVRFTTDDWRTTSDVDAVYLNGSCDGFSDKFNFCLDYSSISGMVGKRLQFCLKFECAGIEYWDNNSGRNYVFQCFGPSVLASQFGHQSESRRKSPPISAPVPVTAQQPFQRTPASHMVPTFSHSPGMHDDPWLRYL